jgi:OOP family OmpA-OmpF porin
MPDRIRMKCWSKAVKKQFLITFLSHQFNHPKEEVMKKGKTMAILGLILTLVLTVPWGHANAVEYCPDNFIFLIDQSGSMYMHFGDPQLKIVVAKNVSLRINNLIPQPNYKGTNSTAALELFAPVQELYAPSPYDRARMATALTSIKDDQEIFGRQTPMGPGIMSLDPVLAKMSGNTAVILISDGMANQGSNPVAEARAIYSRYPNTCIHIISVADTKDKRGKEILTAINKLNSCSIMVEGLDLDASQAALEKFVRDVFCTAKKEVSAKEEVLVLRGINFDFDKSNIKPEWAGVLDEAARIMKERPNMKVMIEGHTDSMGTEPYNQKLSERRAQAVFNYFVHKGISPSRMQTIGYGETRPIAGNAKPNGSDNPEGRAINRRVELRVMK